MAISWDTENDRQSTSQVPSWSAPKMELNKNGKIRDVVSNKDLMNQYNAVAAGSKYDDDCDFYENNLIMEPHCDPIGQDFYGLDDRLVENLQTNMHYTRLNPCQMRTTPLLRERCCVQVEAPTGIGKTASFLIPIVQSIIDLKKPKKLPRQIRALCLSNTTDIAKQTYATAQKMIGVPRGERINEVTVELMVGGHGGRWNDPDILIGCGGTLVSKLEENLIDLSCLQYLIIDEADKMLGFENDFKMNVQKFYEAVDEEFRGDLTIALFSATYPNGFKDDLECTFTSNKNIFYQLTIPPVPGNIEQRVINVKVNLHPLMDKMPYLFQLVDIELKQMKCGKNGLNGVFPHTMIIFCERKIDCQVITCLLQEQNYRFHAIHSDMLKSDTNQSMHLMNERKIQGAVCTNKWARGVDIRSVQHVVIFSMGTDLDVFDHRMGRTGRAGDAGKVTVMVHKKETTTMSMEKIRFSLAKHGQKVPQWINDWIERPTFSGFDDDENQEAKPDFPNFS